MEYTFIMLMTIVLFIMLIKIVDVETEEDIYVDDIEIEEYAMFHEGWHEIVSDEAIVMLKSKHIMMRVTAYAPHDNQSGICAENSNEPLTSTGLIPSYQYVAADPSKLPYGTTLIVPKYGIVTVQDTGGALKNYEGYAIDVYFETYEEAIMWGVKYIEVEVLE